MAAPVLAPGPEVPAPQFVNAVIGVALSFAALVIGFFAIPFYSLRERFRRDHFSDRLLAESRIEDTRIVPALIAISEHVKRRREEHAGEDPGAFLLDVKSRDLVDALIGDVVDYEEFGELYRSCIFHGDSVWKFAVATAALAVLFPALRFVWMVPLNHGVMTLYWMTAAVVGAGLLVTFVLYTGARNRLMRLLENHAN